VSQLSFVSPGKLPVTHKPRDNYLSAFLYRQIPSPRV
jgi:hypothetical protein